MNILRLIKISRSRFWIYVLGTFLVGMIAAGDPRILNTQTLFILGILFLFFSFPANLMIYGINDIFDYETDKFNEKKENYEALVTPVEQSILIRKIALWFLPFTLVIFWLPTSAIIAFIIFIFTGIYYSAKPIRAKTSPPLDIIFSSIIYISPAVIGFFAAGNTNISWIGVVGGLLWAMAMQTYSAVPDIYADEQGGVKTLATFLGRTRSLIFCLIAYTLATVIGYLLLGWIPLLLGIIYLAMVVTAIVRPEKTFLIYKKFPLVNTVFGMILFFLLLSKFL